MKKYFLLKGCTLSILLFSLLCCNENGTEANINEVEAKLTKVVDDYFKYFPLENCISFAVAEEKRICDVKELDGDLHVYIEIPECLKQNRIYYSWIASELQSAIKTKKVITYHFTNKGLKPFFSLVSTQLPNYYSSGNKDVYIDPQINKNDLISIRSIDKNKNIETERDYYFSISKNRLQVNMIFQKLDLPMELDEYEISAVLNFEKEIEKLKLSKPLEVNAIDQYGQLIVNIR